MGRRLLLELRFAVAGGHFFLTGAMRRRYSDQERAEALARLDSNAGNVARTARELAIPRITLLGWRDDPFAAGVSELRQQKRAALADDLEDLAAEMIPVLHEKLGSASFHALVVGLGVVIDKLRLLRAEATEIVEAEALTEDERRARVAELFVRAGAGGTGSAAHGAPAHEHPVLPPGAHG